MDLAICPICAEPVLELSGQFVNLSLYLLGPDDEDIRQAGIYGAVHAACLQASPWGARWASKLIAHSATRLQPLGTRGAVTGFLNPRTQSATLITTEGYRVSVPLASLHYATRTDNGRLFTEQIEYNFTFQQPHPIVPEVQETLRREGSYPLLGFLQAFGLERHLAHPIALENGRLLMDTSLERYWSPSAFSVQIQHGVYVPEEGWALLSASLRSA
ncbi:MAG: hypothetical protein AAFV53_19735 [Myxococcota bacterium]